MTYSLRCFRFPNDPCNTTNTQLGTCYTNEECSSIGGSASGSCASGYGVCCQVVVRTTNSRSSENNTYVESENVVSAGQYRYSICPADSNVCQLRLQFDTFTITGPSISTVSSLRIVNGAPVSAGGVTASQATQCLTDVFNVVNSGGYNVPNICGVNRGEHIYSDIDRAVGSCNDLVFQISDTPVGNVIPATRQWSILVTQHSCDSEARAPNGCTQYFYGSDTGTVKTFNFDGGKHLANQRQTICVRQERGLCRICWYAPEESDFAVSGKFVTTKTASMMGITDSTKCCNYGNAGAVTGGYDCAQIPGALKTTTMKSFHPNCRFCGSGKGLVTSAATAVSKTICSKFINSFHQSFFCISVLYIFR